MHIHTSKLNVEAGSPFSNIKIWPVIACLVAACGGGSQDASSNPQSSGPVAQSAFSIRGQVTGMLSGPLTLKNSGVEEIKIASNGQFVFPTSIKNGAAYEISVVHQPSGQLCSVLNGRGTVSGDVRGVQINCDSSGFFKASADFKQPVPRLTNGYQLAFYSINTNCSTFIPLLKEVNGGAAMYGPNYGEPSVTSACAPTAISNDLKMTWMIDVRAENRNLSISFGNEDLSYRPKSEEDVIQQVKDKVNFVLKDPALSNSVASWYVVPEELRPWRNAKWAKTIQDGNEMLYLQLVHDTIRQTEKAANVAPRPISSYQPGHRDQAQLEAFIGYYDIINIGAYVENLDDPLCVENVYKPVKYNSLASANGTKYLPIAGLNMSKDPPAGMTDQELRRILTQKVYLTAVAGAKGVWIWSYFARTGFSSAARDKMTGMYTDIFRTLNVSEADLGRAFAEGEMGRTDELKPTVTAGKIADLYVQNFFHGGKRYVVALNGSNTAAIEGGLSGWPTGAVVKELNPNLDNNFRTLNTSTNFQFAIEPNGVRVWRVSID